MPTVLGIVVIIVALAVSVWLSLTALNQVKQLRRELDETQHQLNELKAAAEAVPAPPPLPKSRTSGLEDLREQLRAAHREEGSSGKD